MRPHVAATLVLAIAATISPAAEDGFAWTRIAEVHDAVRPYPSPVDPATAYVWTRGGLVVTHDGRRFAPLPAAPSLGEITALLIVPNRPQRLYAGTAERGVFVSDDAGATWSALGGVGEGLAQARIAGLTFAPDDSDYATIHATHGRRGISTSFDGGRTWRAFATDYDASDCLALGTAIFFAGSSPAQGDGIFRFDPARGWLCLLTEEPRSLVASRADPRRVWFGTRGAGLRVSDDFGITMRPGITGPPEGDIVSLAVGWSSAADEVVYAFDPAGEGVMRSRDGFATWERLDDGFAASEWTREGACLAADATGTTLWACRNGELWRGAAPLPSPLRSRPVAQPGAVVATLDAVVFSCRAEPGSRLAIDCSQLGGAKDLAFVAGADGAFTATLGQASPKRPGQFALPITATLGSATARSLAVLTVLPRVDPVPLWNGEAQDDAVPSPGGAVTIARAKDRALSAPAHLRVTIGGAGRAGFSWHGRKAPRGGIDASRHKLLVFSIRSDRAGAPSIRLALRDDGSGSGLPNAQTSSELDLARYLPEVDGDYRRVAIPVADFVTGSTCSPTGLRELVVISAEPGPRVYDLDDLVLLPRAVPGIGAGETP